MSASSTTKASSSTTVSVFDVRTGAWFDGLCRGLQNKPRDGFAGLTGTIEVKKRAAAALFTDQANTLDVSVDEMSGAGAPDIPGGEKIAAAALKAYPKMASAARAAATALATVTSQSALEQAFTAGRDAVTAAAAPLGAYGTIIGNPSLTARLAAVPACRDVIGK